MKNYFAGFEKQAGFFNKKTIDAAKKIKGKIKNPFKGMSPSIGITHNIQAPKGKSIPIKHEIDAQAKKWVNENMGKLTKYLPLKILGGSTLIGAGTTLGSKGADKITGG